jgi:hypothetical protein
MKSIPTHKFLVSALLGLSVYWLSGCVARAPEEPAPEIVVVPPVAQPTEAPAPAEPEPPVVAPEPPAETVTPPAVTQPPPTYNRDDVVWIQQRLQELGYYTGDIDGRAGKATRSSIKAYQIDQSIEADGKPTNELREFMWRNGG